MPSKKWSRIIVVASIVGILLAIFALWIVYTSCCAFYHPHNNTNAPPDYSYSYNLTDNGPIDRVTIKSFFTFYYDSDVRYIETTGNDIEVMLWGKYMSPAVGFEKNGTNLTLDIKVNSNLGNLFGEPFANEYIYLPKNWSYMIISENEHGTTQVSNKSWNYTEVKDRNPGSRG